MCIGLIIITRLMPAYISGYDIDFKMEKNGKLAA